MLIFAVAFVWGFRTFYHRSPKRVTISKIKPYMNFRKVRVEGDLLKPARQLKSGAVFYSIHDGTGQLAVFAPLDNSQNLFWAGSRIAATGSLRVGVGNNKSLQAMKVELLSTPAIAAIHSDVMLADIRAEKEGDTVTVSGVVSKVWKPKDGSKAPHKIVLEDPSGRLDVIHWLEKPPKLEAGDAVEITGVVQVYKGRVEVRVFDAQSIQIAGDSDDPPVEIPVGKITQAHEKQVVITNGRLGPPRSIPGGVIYPLSDDTGTILFLLWDKNVSGEERDMLDEGVRVQVEAPVVIYKGQLELVPKDMGGFQVLD